MNSRPFYNEVYSVSSIQTVNISLESELEFFEI